MFGTTLTIVIAFAAAVQAIYAVVLYRLQKKIEHLRERTFVGLGAEVRRPDPNASIPYSQKQLFLRLENASGVGVWIQHIKVVVTAKGRTGDPATLTLNTAIGPYLSREFEVSDVIRGAAIQVDSADPDWNNAPHSADVEFAPHYSAEGREADGQAVRCRIKFSAQWYESVEYLTS